MFEFFNLSQKVSYKKLNFNVRLINRRGQIGRPMPVGGGSNREGSDWMLGEWELEISDLSTHIILTRMGEEKAVRYPRFNYRDYGEYQPRDTLAETSRAALLSTGAGVFAAAIKASLGPARTSLGSIITHSRYIWLYGMERL